MERLTAYRKTTNLESGSVSALNERNWGGGCDEADEREVKAKGRERTERMQRKGKRWGEERIDGNGEGQKEGQKEIRKKDEWGR
jgi:hypothetical protein